ncbi:hypothetical protein LCGC14_0694280 [marine sediment metagenome]|uniref:Uncharacterized protein n=1 Tax=marine sediment metagenome TaxID=412755 RepID=A0A0F9T5W3_9ZZZZ
MPDKSKKGGALISKVKGQTSIQCSKCRDIKAVRREVFLKRIEKFGSVGKLIANYKCQKCRNGAKNGIQCVQCKEIKAVRRDVYKKRIEWYGSEEKLVAKYLCRKCRRIAKHEKKMQAMHSRKAYMKLSNNEGK